jgi:hypothetical protein
MKSTWVNTRVSGNLLSQCKVKVCHVPHDALQTQDMAMYALVVARGTKAHAVVRFFCAVTKSQYREVMDCVQKRDEHIILKLCSI